MRKLAIFALLVLACGMLQAAQLGVDPNAGDTVKVKEIIHPLAPQSITQSLDPNTLVDGTSVACVGATTTENAWLRLFDLAGDHGLSGAFDVESLDWGVQGAVGPAEIQVSAYCLDDGLPFLYQFLTLVGQSSVINIADESLTFKNTLLTGSCDADTQDLAMEIFAEDCAITGCTTFFVGMNDLGQTGPSYVASASCGLIDPGDLAGLGFPDAHLVMVVNGEGTGDGGGDGGSGDGGGDGGGVPATTGVGLVLLVLALGGGSAYFLRRK
jgi:hypothetical protein